jgi:hypothetical protein
VCQHLLDENRRLIDVSRLAFLDRFHEFGGETCRDL